MSRIQDSRLLSEAYKTVLEFELNPKQDPREPYLDEPTREDKEDVNQALSEPEDKAIVHDNMIAVEPSINPTLGDKRLTFKINGYDDVKKYAKKILEYKGDFYKFRGWNSDRNVCFFAITDDVAKIK